jgi:hypothetical protein
MSGTLPRGTSKPVDRVRFRLGGISRPYDARTHAIRDDLADIALAEHYFAPHYAQPVGYDCASPGAIVRAVADTSAGAITQLLHGERFQVLDQRAGWAWGYCAHDHYVGYVQQDALAAPITPTHRAAWPLLVFTRPDIKSPVVMKLPLGGSLSGEMAGDFLALATGGFVHQRHILPVEAAEQDAVSVAERLLGTPYRWGGRGDAGLDCSGLVQIALAACGVMAPRDTDQQRASAAMGGEIDPAGPLERGDAVFFPGHVGLMVDGERLIHANAHWMRVTVEPLADVIARLSVDHAEPILAVRRPVL